MAGKAVAMVAVAVVVAILSLVAGTATAGAQDTITYLWQPGTPVNVLKQLVGEASVDEGDDGWLATLPNGLVTSGSDPLGIPGPTHVVQVVDGADDFMALAAPSGLSGCPTNTSVWAIRKDAATVVPGLTGIGVVQIAEASDKQFALTCTGQVYAWGNNSKDTLDFPANVKYVGSPTVNPVLTALTGGTAINVVITVGESFGSLLVKGQAYAWGNNTDGECGCGSTASVVYTPTPVVQHGVSYTWVDAGGDQGYDGSTVALDADGQAYCWGDNEKGQCGLIGPNLTEPTLVSGLPALKDARAGGEYSLFLGQDGSVWVAGESQPAPVEALPNGSATQISAGSRHAVAAE
ncbi:MAG: hypothetical protein WBG41_12410 [Acidimicrobiales bacterium]